MLNAFRHHRGGHLTGSLGDERSAECSTPFGITEVGISYSTTSISGSGVLNAFRHHRGGHAARFSGLGGFLGVLNAFRHHRGGHHLMVVDSTLWGSAQRLSASQRWASGRRRLTVWLEGVLNAFRHHRGGHWKPEIGRKTPMAGAQRLSASQRWASASGMLPS